MRRGTTSPDIVVYTEAPEPGGVTHVIDMLTEDPDTELRQTLVCGGNPGLRAWRENAAARGLSVKTFALRGKIGITNWLDFPNIIRLIRQARRARVLHFHLHTPFSCSAAITMAGLFSHTPIVITEHYITQLGYLRRRKLSRAKAALRELKIRLLIFMKMISLRFVDRIVAVSDSNRDYIVQRLGQTLSERTQVIPNGIEVQLYAPGYPQNDGPVASESPVVVTVAGLNNQKGHEYLFHAIAGILPQFPRTRFLLVGDGHLRGHLEAMATNLGIRNAVEFMGYRSDIPAILERADVFVLPSLFEGLPLSLLEAMAAGKPVVATDVDGSHDVVLDGVTGFLVPPRDSEALIKTIASLLGNEEMRSNFGKAGRERALKLYSSKRMYEDYLALYYSLLK